MNIKVVETKEEREQAYQVRMKVFVEEQKVPEELELDELEDTAIHFLGLEDEHPVVASRLRFVDEYGKLERICVLKEYRGKSYGKDIIQAMELAAIRKGYKKSKLNAQTHAEEFYKKLGYKTISSEFMDAGIPHVTMVKELES
ncbi:GNAT family N-acetyltransferase [Oceanobacillus bengalensis]|uniref:GNAT family N-acetyltransferase n=1 Tax=Oceanobacillus bengalensis TaxID=1435466 RepID=A0A494YVA6_9BACI|nr:GNAT family N-acetyltransferase [Oceanobacillus bengalensis]RKQ14129.1 GNAT family N-acetyltransferase [Oceanobacillus bengalensis]